MDILYKLLNYELDNGRKKSMKEKAIQALAGFFVLMLIFTVLSRSASALTTPKVNAVSPEAMAIDHNQHIAGEIFANRDILVSILGNIKIASVGVSEGQTVKTGAVLFTLDTEDLNEQIQKEKDTLERMELQQLDLKAAGEQEAKNKQKTAERASEDYENALSDTDKKILDALNEMNEAKSKFDKAKAELSDSGSYKNQTAVKRAIEDYDKASASADEKIRRELEDMNDTKSDNDAKRSELQAAQAREISSRQIAIDRATQDYKLTAADENKKIQSAIAAMNDAEYKLENYTGTDADIKAELQNDLTMKTQAYEDALSNKYRALISAQRAIDDADSIEIASITEQLKALDYNYKLKQQIYEDAVKDKDSTLSTAQRAVDDAYASVDEQLAVLAEDYSARKQAYEALVEDKGHSLTPLQRAVEDANNPDTVSHSADIAELDMKAQKQKINKLEALKAGNGLVKAPGNGTVKKLNVSVGDRTGDGVAVLLTDPTSGFSFKAKVEQDKAAYFNEGDPVTLTLSTDNKKLDNLKIASKYTSLEDNSFYEISVNITADSGNPGSTASMELNKQPVRYNNCVPLEALHKDGNKTYILVLTEKSNVLGSETIAERIDVTVLDKNDTYAAIDGSFADTQQFVSGANKPIKPGDRVQVEGE